MERKAAPELDVPFAGMTAHRVGLPEQVTFLLGRHDPGRIFGENPDAPPDEYSDEADQILARLERQASEREVREVVSAVFNGAIGPAEVDHEAIVRAARDIHFVLRR